MRTNKTKETVFTTTTTVWGSKTKRSIGVLVIPMPKPTVLNTNAARKLLTIARAISTKSNFRNR